MTTIKFIKQWVEDNSPDETYNRIITHFLTQERDAETVKKLIDKGDLELKQYDRGVRLESEGLDRWINWLVDDYDLRRERGERAENSAYDDFNRMPEHLQPYFDIDSYIEAIKDADNALLAGYDGVINWIDTEDGGYNIVHD